MVDSVEKKPSSDLKDTVVFPERIFLITQAEKPREVKNSLLKSAISNGWIGMLVNINAAMFAGMISLTADFGAVYSLIFLAIHFCTTFIGTVIILYLQLDQQNKAAIRPNVAEFLLTFVDLLVMLSWGVGILFFLSPEYYDRSLLVIVLLTAAGIGAATLNSRLLLSLLSGRIALFVPCIVYFLVVQPPFWGLLICTLFFAAIVSIGIGYAVHVQHLNEENYGLKLREISVLLEQQSFSLEQSLIQRTKTQERLLKETKLREKFLHSVNHDLNQPLSALALYLNELANRANKEAREIVVTAQHCLSSAKSLIQNMSQLAWIEEHLPPPKLTSVKLQSLLSQITEDTKLLAEEKDVKIDFVPTSVSVIADPDYLERVVRNLVHNAIQYSTKGRILVGTRRRPNGIAEIVVADNGLGISREHQDKIFEEFYQIDIHTSKRAGNIGLGLSIVKDLVNAMNGEITLQSVENRGTIFGIILPVAGTPKAQAPLVVCEKGLKENPKSVLLIEDQAEYLHDISELLINSGYNIETASSRDEIDQISSETLSRFDFLLLDFNLGETLTAWDVLERSEENLLPRTLVVSQYDNPEVILKTKARGGRFLKKPFSQKDLENALQALNSQNFAE